jgi:hypothetical protein
VRGRHLDPLVGATVRNDFGKRGRITILADEGNGQVKIGATVVDDGPEVSSINGRAELPHEGFANVIGPADLDV